jgi:hypothetical protein
MSTIPEAVTPWASVTTTFPAGADPWSGQPTSVAPAGDVFTPEEPSAAEYHNYLFNKIGGDHNTLMTYVKTHVGAIGVQNWGPLQDSSLITNIRDMGYNELTRRWYASAFFGVTEFIAESGDGGQTWEASSGGTLPAIGIGMFINQATGDVYLHHVSNGHRYKYNGASVTDVALGAEFENVSHIETADDGAYFFKTFENVNDGLVRVFRAVHATPDTWVNKTTAFTTWSTSVNRPGIAVIPGGNLTIVVARALADVKANTYYTSTDHGDNFTERTFGTTVYPGAYTSEIESISYSPTYGKFYLSVTLSSASRIFSSPDAITWTEIAGVGNARITSIAERGGILCAASTGNSTQGVWYSQDAGVSWSQAETYLPLDATSETADEFHRTMVLKGATRLAIFNGTGARFGLATG